MIVRFGWLVTLQSVVHVAGNELLVFNEKQHEELSSQQQLLPVVTTDEEFQFSNSSDDNFILHSLTKHVAQRTLLLEQSAKQQSSSAAATDLNNKSVLPNIDAKVTTNGRRTLKSILLDQQQSSSSSHNQRQLQSTNNNNNNNSNVTTCASAFVSCHGSVACSKCIESEVDTDVLFGVAATTRCVTVLQALQKKNICSGISNDIDMNIFCNLFTGCTGSEFSQNKYNNNNNNNNDDNGNNNNNNNAAKIDCTTLTECNWPGMKKEFWGDGVCHEYYDGGCYNTPICNYDGGDCCQDTCVDVENRNSSSIFHCGVDGYACRNPKSLNCDPSLSNSKCKNSDSSSSSSNEDRIIKCESGTTMYRVLMYDSFGDGWEDTFLAITSGGKSVFNNQLKYGAYDVQYVCLSTTEPTCYDVNLKGGAWGREISWEIRGLNPGSPSVASGGAPMSCQFGTAGATMSNKNCPNTCTGMSASDTSTNQKQKDVSYKSLKDLQQCINDVCYIQVAACADDEVCKDCFQDLVPDSCFSSPSFIALSDCAVCKCSKEVKNTSFCNKKATPDAVDKVEGCSATEKLTSGRAVMTYVGCTNFTSDAVLNQLFDNDNFGALDTFESCALAYVNQSADHRDRTALGCMQLLANAMYPDGSNDSRTYHPQAIAELATEIYTNAEAFCKCSQEAYYNTAASCQGYSNFKILLRESLDACGAMDYIDCAAWKEYSGPCNANMMNKFKTIDFTKAEQCQYLQDTCGGVGKFPAMNQLLDCQHELDAKSWEFYNDYYRTCLLKGQEPVPVPVQPQPTPTSNNVAPEAPVTPPTDNIPVVPGPAPTGKKPYVPPEERGKGGNNKPYVPADDNSSDSKKEATPSTKKKSHWFRNLVWMIIIGYAGYQIYIRRHYFSSYQRLNSSPFGNFFGFLENIPFLNRFFGGGGGGGFGARSYGGNQYNFTGMGDPDDMYTGLSMEGSSVMSTTAFQPTSLPPGPASFMGSGSIMTSNTSGNYAI